MKKVAFLLFIAAFASCEVFAQCPEQVALPIEDTLYRGTLLLTQEAATGYYDYELDIDEPCDLTFRGTVVPSGNGVIFEDSVLLLDVVCENGDMTGVVTLYDPCDSNSGNPTSTPVGGEDGGGGDDGGDDGDGGDGDGDGDGDDDDGDDGDDGETGAGSGQIEERSSSGSSQRPVARLIGIDVEINPPVLEISAAASNAKSTQNEPDVTITGRLLFSNDNVPEDFNLNAEGWDFMPKEAGDNTKYKDWKSALFDVTHLDFLGWEVPGKEDWDERGWQEDDWEKFEKIAINGLFQIDTSILPANIQSKQVPIRASYTDDEGVEYSKVVNLRIAKKTKNRPVANSSGPAMRVVTYSRILE